MSDACLLLFAKPPRPGRVKTRLIGAEMSAERAAALYGAFLDDLVERLAQGAFTLRLLWALETEEAMPPAPESVGGAMRQRGGDLGERLFEALAEAARDHALVAAVGSDHPDLPLARVESAFERLRDGRQMVLGPSADGGYYLIGVRAEALAPGLFARIPWSTPRVLEETLERARGLGLDAELLAEETDVDEPADLRALVARLAAGRQAPRTRALLDQWGWMEGGIGGR